MTVNKRGLIIISTQVPAINFTVPPDTVVVEVPDLRPSQMYTFSIRNVSKAGYESAPVNTTVMTRM